MDHEKFMKRALELAKMGVGNVAPNPLVGCVIVRDNEIIAEGYHMKYGEYHAEVNAIMKLPNHFDFSDCTVYVNLEPCSHFGKTPPCCDLLIQKKVKKVVIANTDSNPKVSGTGIERMRNNGIEIITGVLNDEARILNKRFFTYHEQHRPYVILKWAETADGFISKTPIPVNPQENWISCDESKRLVHQWRAEEQAIMVGTNTVLTDNPELTTRLVEGKNPIRILIDRELKLPLDSKVFLPNANTIVFNERKNIQINTINYISLSFDDKLLTYIMHHLYNLNIQSLLVEGGTTLLNTFIKQGLWDEARIFIGKKHFGQGLMAPKLSAEKVKKLSSGSDQLLIMYNSNETRKC